MAFDFPNAPTTGQVANGYQWDGEKWKGGIPGVAGPQKEQYFDCSGLSVKDIVVPAWAKGCTISGNILCPTVGTYAYMRYSLDGTNFFAGAADYNSGGPLNNSGSAGYTQSPPGADSLIYLTFSGDNAASPYNFTADISTLTRPNTTMYLGHARIYGKAVHSSNVAYYYRTSWTSGHLAAASSGSNLAIKALRIGMANSGVMQAGSYLHVRWLGDDAQLPVSNAVPEAPQDGGEYVRVNGVWRLVKQSYDLAGLNLQNMLVPAWGPKQARITANAYLASGAARNIILRASADGTTYFAGATHYPVFGFYDVAHIGITNQAEAAVDGWLLDIGVDNATIPHKAAAIVNLTRPSTGTVFNMQNLSGTTYGTSGFYTSFVSGYLATAATTSLTLGGLQWRIVPSGNAVAGNLDVEWLA